MSFTTCCLLLLILLYHPSTSTDPTPNTDSSKQQVKVQDDGPREGECDPTSRHTTGSCGHTATAARVTDNGDNLTAAPAAAAVDTGTANTATAARNTRAQQQRRQTQEERPIQLVRPDPEHKKLVIIEENAKLLSTLSGPVATIAVVGKYHSGKSFLMNQLMGKSNGFGIGPSVRPQTMGIWMWGRPVNMTLYPSGDTVSVLYLDTEGFAANNISETYDAKIFAVSTLLSSYLLYNSVKIIDQSDVDYLELLARRTQLFALRSQMVNGKFTDFDLNLLTFPPLIWVVQDFVQSVEDDESTNPRQWLHQLLQSRSRESDLSHDISLLHVFKHVDCHTLFLPATSRHLLMDLSQARESELTAEYRAEREELLHKIRSGLIVKQKQSRAITGAELYQLLHILVQAANEGSLAQIPSRWHIFIDRIRSTATEDCISFYDLEMTSTEPQPGQPAAQGKAEPSPPATLQRRHEAATDKALTLLAVLLYGLDESITEASESLLEAVNSKYVINKELNEKKIVLKCNDLITRATLYIESEIQSRISYPVHSDRLQSVFSDLRDSSVEEYYQITSSLLTDDEMMAYVERLQSGLRQVYDSVTLRNIKAFESLCDSCTQATLSWLKGKVSERTALVAGGGGGAAPLAQVELHELMKSLKRDAVSYFGAQCEAARGEHMYETHLRALTDRVSQELDSLAQSNARRLQQFAITQVTVLVSQFRADTDHLSLPMNETELSVRLAEWSESRVREYREVMVVYDDYPHYTQYLQQLQEQLESASVSRRQQNVEAFTQLVERPLQTAKRQLLLVESNYGTEFSLRLIIYDLCMTLLNESGGTPAAWDVALKADIIQHFIESDPDIQGLILQRHSLLARVHGFLQWLLWVLGLITSS